MTALRPKPEQNAPDDAAMLSVGTRLAPPPRAEPIRRRQLAALLSVLLHAAVLALLILRFGDAGVELTPDQAVEMVFEGSSAAATPGEAPAPDSPPPAPVAEVPPAATDPAPPAPEPTPTPTEPPNPDAPPPEPVPEQVPVQVPVQVPPITPPEPEMPAPAPRSIPIVRLDAPEAPAPEPLVPSFEPPAAPRALPRPLPLPRRPLAPVQQAVQQAVRPAQRPRYADGFSPPIDLSFGKGASPASPRQHTGPASRAVDLSPGAPKAGPDRAEAFFDARARRVGADWASGLQTYWVAHRYYPRQAAENGEDGTVKVELVVNRSGKVESVEVIGKSGSPWLDMAALSTWRGAQLAPFPAENPDLRTTMSLTINYILIR